MNCNHGINKISIAQVKPIKFSLGGKGKTQGKVEPQTTYMLCENGSYMLCEDGGKIIL